MLELSKYQSIGEALRDALDQYSNEVCLIEADREREKERLTYRDFNERAHSLAKALQDAKVLVASNRLRPTSAATTVRTVDGQTKVLDGPFAETKEQLGGYYLINVPDLDAALSWAARCPGAAHGTIEVRPIWEMTDYLS